MCGIVGILSLDGTSIDLAVLQKMNDLQAHRGPDGEAFLLGCFFESPFRCEHTLVPCAMDEPGSMRPQVAFGHRRLAILDLSDRGSQPMTAGEGYVWIVYNGEIYNHVELRSTLEAKGYTFTTRTDTEVLLQAYREWGLECLSKIEGMYAFAIWDGTGQKLFCARDRFGIKPFYYTIANGFFVFASEIKSLLAFPGVEAAADDNAVLSFLVHGNCDYGERTIFQGVKALPAAHFLKLELATGQVSLQKYYQLKPQRLNTSRDDELIEGLRELLIETTRKHLISDVPVGSCLSGGLDSSTVVSLIGKICRGEPKAATALGGGIRTFTSCYEYQEIDERNYALAVANAVGATPTLVFPSPDDFWSEFDRLTWHQDMPFGGLSFYAQWRVMRAAAEAGVKVLLDGQGGDEVFGGYAKFRYAYLASLLRTGRFTTLIREFGATLMQGDSYVLDLRKGYRYLPARVRELLRLDSLLKEVLDADLSSVLQDQSTPATRWWRNAYGYEDSKGGVTTMQRIQLDDILLDTLPQLLRIEDRSSMAFSIEARVPLLDHRLVEYGISLPDHLKVNKGWSKYAVREALRGLMPEQVRLRKSKLGFAAPDRIWLLHSLRKQIDGFIGGELRCSKYVKPVAIREWYRSAKAKKANTESYLGMFRILSLEAWMRVFNVS